MCVHVRPQTAACCRRVLHARALRTFQVAGAVVQHVSVDLARRHNDHEGVAPGLGVEDAVHQQRAERAPQEGSDGLRQAARCEGSDIRGAASTASSHGQLRGAAARPAY